MPSSRGSSQPRDWTQVSHIAGGFLTVWATREAHSNTQYSINYSHHVQLLVSMLPHVLLADLPVLTSSNQ